MDDETQEQNAKLIEKNIKWWLYSTQDESETQKTQN